MLESLYTAYRLTRHNTTYNLPGSKTNIFKEQAWDIFIALSANARTGSGFNFLGNVDVVGGEVDVGDNMESYFFAETLKYLYLTLEKGQEGREWHVDGVKEESVLWVYNTEGHPFRVREMKKGD